MLQRLQRCGVIVKPSFRHFTKHSTEIKTEYDAVIIGGGHNGLVAAGYLQRNGKHVCVLERRHVVGGAAVTEEIVPGFKFSRASYVLSLLRPHIYRDLELEKHGLRVYLRDPSSYTPLREEFWTSKNARSLTRGSSADFNSQQIAKFSKKDAQNYEKYETELSHIVDLLNPLLDTSARSIEKFLNASTLWQRIKTIYEDPQVLRAGVSLSSRNLPKAWELITAPIEHVLDQWFESEPLRATLATDAVIGAMVGPRSPGSGYVLLHHVMGELEGRKGAWGYPEGGMGAVSEAIARSAATSGADIFVDKEVQQILLDCSGKARGVVCADGQEIKAGIVLSNATPDVTFLKLLPKNTLSSETQQVLRKIDYSSPVTKINVAVSRLPNFVADPCRVSGRAEAHHQASIHINCETMGMIEEAFQSCAKENKPSKRPMIEMVIPSVLDKTLAPEGAHVCLLFTQYTPFGPPHFWTDNAKEAYANTVFSCIEDYAPGFKESVIAKDVLTPPDLEQIFGLTGGNIFHGSMALHQLFLSRPAALQTSLVPRLALCGAGSHPGGGVMGSPGYLAAKEALRVLRRNK